MIITNSALYDKLKWLALIGLPALGTAYFALAGIWGLPAAEQVVGTIVTIDTLLGTVLGISTKNYSSENVGDILMEEHPDGKKTFTLAVNDDAEKIEDVNEARFQVKPAPKPSARKKPGGGVR